MKLILGDWEEVCTKEGQVYFAPMKGKGACLVVREDFLQDVLYDKKNVKHIGVVIKESRHQLDLSQMELVELIQEHGGEISQGTISKLEKGHSKASVDTIRYLSLVLGLSLEYLFDCLQSKKGLRRTKT